MVSKFARTIVYTALGVAYLVQASDKTCTCTNGSPETNCEKTTDKKCKSCDDGFFLAGNHCEACSAGDVALKFDVDSDHKVAFTQCNKCGVGGNCTEVKSDAFYLGSGIAKKCHDGCTACTEATTCKANSATDGYFLDADKKPKDCADGCSKCAEAEKCSAGENEDGFRLDADVKPVACDDAGCKQCDADKAQCAEAKPRYYLDGTTTGACAANCAVCTKTECTTADSRYVVKSGATAVDACAANCLACAAKDKCTTPEEGYYVNAEETTTACTTGCATCDKATTDDGKCLTPKSGYLLDADDKPHACPQGCDVCHVGNDDKTKCNADGEKIGYFLKDLVPTACEAGCAKCTDATTCLIPLPTHYRNDEGNLAVCGDKCELCLGKKCIKEKSASGSGSGDNVSGASVSGALSMVVAFAVGMTSIEL